MITQYGMSDKFGMMGLESRESLYLDNGTRLNCSEQMAAEVDQEIMRILRESYEEAKRLLTENREALDKIAEYLIEKETITGKEFMKIFREVKGIPDPDAPKAEEVLEETASVEEVLTETITDSADTTIEETTTEETTVQDMP